MDGEIGVIFGYRAEFQMFMLVFFATRMQPIHQCSAEQSFVLSFLCSSKCCFTREIVGLEVNRMGEAAPMLVAAFVIFAVSLVACILAVAGAGFLGGTAILFDILGAVSLVSEMRNDEVSRSLGLLEMRSRRFQFPGGDLVQRALLSPIWRQVFLASTLLLGFVIFFFVFLL